MFRVKLFVGVLALAVASGALALDKGTKATAVQNIEDRPGAGPQVTQSVASIAAYDRGTKATAAQNIEARKFVPEAVLPAETAVAAVKTVRGDAKDVSFTRPATIAPTSAVQFAVPASRSGEKPSFWATHSN